MMKPILGTVFQFLLSFPPEEMNVIKIAAYMGFIFSEIPTLPTLG